MGRTGSAGRVVDAQLRARTRHFVTRRILFAFQLRSVWQARGYLSHRGDRPTYPEPGERLLAVTASEHPIGALGGLEFGVVAVLVQHQVRGAVDVQVRENRIFLRCHNITVVWIKDE